MQCKLFSYQSSLYFTVDCGFTKWSDWSKCTKTCGEASKSRTRTATNPPHRGIGKKCVGPLRETKDCGLTPCDGKYLQCQEISVS